MEIKKAIILAGGLGTRLRSAVPDLPKCMAPVAGQPFLFHVIRFLRSQGIESFLFSLGFRHEMIEDYLSRQFSTLRYQVVVESDPLGTGGAIRLACSRAGDETVVVVNGDTIFRVNVAAMAALHDSNNSECTLALKPLRQFNRYGAVELSDGNRISAFREKQFLEEGLINGGVYLLNAARFCQLDLPKKFSFEKDYLEAGVNSHRFFGSVQSSYFIDIGIPEDFSRAQTELQMEPLTLDKVDENWTLFVDRDGVINEEKKDEYVRNWGEFHFMKGAKEALAILSSRFGRIIVISNQRGVGRGLMTEEDLERIHLRMKEEVNNAGGRINKIYYCTSTDNTHPCRKPNPGMAFLAARDFPAIDLSRTIMIGNKPSDMLFGRMAGVYTVFVATTNPEHPRDHSDIDLSFNSLEDFAKAL